MKNSEISTRLYNTVSKLTKVHPPRNYINTKVLNEVAEFIHGEFSKLQCKPRFQGFSVDGNEYKNVIANFGPEDGSLIVVGAHYDVCGDQPGADDNASGSRAS